MASFPRSPSPRPASRQLLEAGCHVPRLRGPGAMSHACVGMLRIVGHSRRYRVAVHGQRIIPLQSPKREHWTMAIVRVRSPGRVGSGCWEHTRSFRESRQQTIASDRNRPLVVRTDDGDVRWAEHPPGCARMLPHDRGFENSGRRWKQENVKSWASPSTSYRLHRLRCGLSIPTL